MPLEEYRRKRDFSATPEPSGAEPAPDAPALKFVVQKHAARALHYDFRLELDGVLLSWAIPKGPSYDSHEKRLAVHVEDHPLEYGGFEGTIPVGEYGGGTVIVWDHGTWTPVHEPHAALEKGDLKFELAGEKLTGRWVLVRMRPRPGEKRENWLLIKEKDEFVRPHEEFDVVAEMPDSAISGRSIDEVAHGEGAAAGSDTPERVPASAARAPEADEPASIPPSRARRPRAAANPSKPNPSRPPKPLDALPLPIDVELATLVETAPEGDGWIAEAKYDGYRLVLALENGRGRAFTRNHADWSDRFAPLCRAVEGLPAVSAVLDGEAVVFDKDGVSRFELLQRALGAHPEKIAFAAFDLLVLNGHDLRDMPLAQRKELLRTLLADEGPTSRLRYADHIDSSARELYAHACSAGLEGVVCKRADSRYVAGRGRDWQKVKCRHTQELVVGGYTEGQGSRGALGSLLVGAYEGGELVYAGRVGSGFDDATLAALTERLGGLGREDSPFSAVPRVSGHVVHWVEPTLVIEAAFREWTSEGVLRQPVFLGVREDKPAAEVVREQPSADADDVAPIAAGATAGATVPGSDAAKPAPRSKRESYGKPTELLGVKLTNPDKPLFPDSDFSKLALAEYYAAAAPTMLPHIAGRPLTLVRCPVGHGRACFYQRHPDAGLSPSIRTVSHTLTGHPNPDELLVVDTAEGLVALAQMGALEIHTWLSHVDGLTRPDRIVFDLDPGPGVTWPQICEAARIVRTQCDALGFAVYVKSTGS
ncbi:MAG: DNA ligase D [Coriobacteriia bacterium]|nr:DNA ligase D [Coriobacteriia bacterium]